MVNYSLMWNYIWGRLPDHSFFHFVEFRKNGKRWSHFSLNGEFLEGDYPLIVIEAYKKYGFKTPKLSLNLEINSSSITHDDSPSHKHISWPVVSDGLVDAWMEYEYFNFSPTNWEWIALKIGDLSIIAYQNAHNPFSKLILKGKVINSKFEIATHLLYLLDLGMCFYLEPIKSELIFHPKQGRPYSETPFNVIFRTKKIGFGVREKTYKEGV